jgi:hypothetical protein
MFGLGEVNGKRFMNYIKQSATIEEMWNKGEITVQEYIQHTKNLLNSIKDIPMAREDDSVHTDTEYSEGE